MARPAAVEDIVQFAMAQRSRSVVCLAAVSFALCHLTVLATSVAAGDVDSALSRELIHFGAVFCRFFLPFGLMLFGLRAHLRAKRASRTDN